MFKLYGLPLITYWLNKLLLIYSTWFMRMNTKKLLALILFFFLGLAADNIKVASIWGAPGQTFTLLQLFAPAAGAFLGGLFGLLAVLLTEVASFIIQGKDATLINMLRFLPLLLATVYFASITHPAKNWARKILEITVPAAAILLFWLHPIGRAAWPYALYWLIPMAVSILPVRKFLFAQALGSTFIAHAIGSVVFLYLTAMPAVSWLALIPVVAKERLVFGLGITVTYLIFNWLFLSLPYLKSLSLTLNYRYHFWPAIEHKA